MKNSITEILVPESTKYTEKSVQKIYRELTELLIEKGITISTFESCTSGMVASLLTDTEGSSKVYFGSYVTYSNHEKIRLGISENTIEKYTVYSQETANEMARVCRDDFLVNIGVGVTGTTGNIDPENPKNSNPGEVYFTINRDRLSREFLLKIPHQETRHQYKLAVAAEIGKTLLGLLKS